MESAKTIRGFMRNASNDAKTQPPPVLDVNTIYRKVITIRPVSSLKPAMEIIVTQRVNEQGEIVLPMLIYKGEYPNGIESWRFCRDYGLGWIQASFIMLERSMFVKGRK